VSGEPSGYLHPRYAASFEEIATPRELIRCGGWILERQIEGSNLRDGMGCYPLFCCRDWSRLPKDLADLAGDLVSVTIVTDPFARVGLEDLRGAFDVVRPFKRHYVTDLTSYTGSGTRRHQRNTAKAMQAVVLDRVVDPMAFAGQWIELYGHLSARHRLTGLQAFSPRCLTRQLAVPGLRMFTATEGGRTVGLHLWYVQGDVAYGHLGATSSRGYELMASYALYAFAIEQLRSEVRWLALGGSAGRSDDEEDGLTRFKEGWATGTRQAYLCGVVVDRDAYARLSAGHSMPGYFPAYRCGELVR